MSLSIEFENLDNILNSARNLNNDLDNNMRKFLERVSQRLSDLISIYSTGVTSDVTVKVEGTRKSPVYTPEIWTSNGFTTTYTINDRSAALTVNGGKDLMFIEFGAGYGVKENPLSKKISTPTQRGSYGKGQGIYEYWYFSINGQKYMGVGTPASMPICKAIEQVQTELETIAKGVFG